jgi:dye decolorizing peroxidase
VTTRRSFLGYLGAAAGGAAAGGFGGFAVGSHNEGQTPAAIAVRNHSPYGAHQAGVAAPAAQVTEVVALDLLNPADAQDVARLLRVWTGDIAALMGGRPAPGDTAAGIAQGGVDLTVTIGVGPGAFIGGGLRTQRPEWLEPIPAMRHDALESRWSDGDVVAVVSAADGTTAAHAVRRLVADAEPFARLRWRQSGFWNPYDADGRPTTGRNLFGQVDGSGNARVGTSVYDETVWSTEPQWMAGGTSLVVRRIRMDLAEWDKLTRFEQERSVGRDLKEGAFLSGGGEFDAPDFELRRDGEFAIGLDAHARLSHPTMNAGLRIVRKGSNYVNDVMRDGKLETESGLIFLSYQADPVAQFVPIQRRLDSSDALNAWTRAIGSAVFAILPGFGEGEWLGQALFAQR